jgi:hypothetical protein
MQIEGKPKIAGFVPHISDWGFSSLLCFCVCLCVCVFFLGLQMVGDILQTWKGLNYYHHHEKDQWILLWCKKEYTPLHEVAWASTTQLIPAYKILNIKKELIFKKSLILNTKKHTRITIFDLKFKKFRFPSWCKSFLVVK